MAKKPRDYWRWVLLVCAVAAAVVLFAGFQDQSSSESGEGEEDIEFLRARDNWFYGQRAYPLGHIPGGARLKAVSDLDRLLAREAYLRARAAEFTSEPLDEPQWVLVGPAPTTVPDGAPKYLGTSPVAGRVTALAVDPSDKTSKTVYLGAADGGIWKTTDGGTNWKRLMDQEPSLAVGSIALDSSSGDPKTTIVYVGTGEENFSSDSYYGAGILVGKNGGENGWMLIGKDNFGGPFPGGEGGAHIGSLAIHPTKTNVLLAAVSRADKTKAGIYRSEKNGEDWSLVRDGGDGTAVVFNPTNPNIAYAALGTPTNGGFPNGIWKSSDEGKTWIALTDFPPTTGDLGRIALAISVQNPDTLFTGIQTTKGCSQMKPSCYTLLGFFGTIDGGKNGYELTTPQYCGTGSDNAPGQCEYDNTVAILPSDKCQYNDGKGTCTVLAGGSVNDTSNADGAKTLILSSNFKDDWKNLTVGMNGETLHADTHALAFSADGKILYAGNDGGVWSTTDVAPGVNGVNWKNLNAKLSIGQFYPGISINPKNPMFGLGGTQDNGTQRHKEAGSLVWDYAVCGDGGWTAIDASKDPPLLYSACAGGKTTLPHSIRRSSGNGDVNTWDEKMNGINLKGDFGNFDPPLAMDPTNSDTLYFGTRKVWQTVNDADDWKAVSADLPGPKPREGSPPTISVITPAPLEPEATARSVFAGTTDGKVWVTLIVSKGEKS